MADIVGTATGAVKAPISWAKQNWIAMVLLITAIVFVVMRNSATMVAKVTAMSDGPVKKALKFLLGISTFVVLSLVAGDASAAVANHVQAEGASVTQQIAGYLASGGGVMGMAIATNLGSARQIDLKTVVGAKVVTLTPGTTDDAEFVVSTKEAKKGGRFVKVTDFTYDLATVLTQQASGGSAIDTDQLPRLVSRVDIKSENFGHLTHQDSCSGPMLKHVHEFLAFGFRTHDNACAQIASTGGTTSLLLRLVYPLVERWAYRPHDFAMWLGHLQNTVTKVTLAPTGLGAVSTGATIVGGATTLKAGLRYVLDSDYEVPTLSWREVFSVGAQGQAATTCLNIEQNGPDKTVKAAGVFAILELMNVLGLGGAQTADNILRLHAPQLGIDDVQNVSAWVGAKLETMPFRTGSTMGSENASYSGVPYAKAAAAIANGVGFNASTLAYLAWLLPSLGMKLTDLPAWVGNLELSRDMTTPPSSGTHKICVCSARVIDPAFRPALYAQAGVKPRATAPVFSNGTGPSDGTKPGQAAFLPRAAG